MSNKRRDDGTYKKQISDEEFLKLFEESEYPVLSATMIDDKLPISRHSIHVRLNKLHDEGRINKLKIGANSVVWWPVEDDNED